jgi:dTDP-4-dehydrorhamnose 3,5-epimerase
VKATELSISGAWEFVPQQFPDDRGNFLVWYDAAAFADALGFELSVVQANHSISRRGVVRGVHWADVPVGQAKYVYCPRGSLLDIIVDLRVGSPTFGQHEVVRLDTVDYRAVYLSEGLGHAFVALEDDSELSYLCSAGYAPTRERIVNFADE